MRNILFTAFAVSSFSLSASAFYYFPDEGREVSYHQTLKQHEAELMKKAEHHLDVFYNQMLKIKAQELKCIHLSMDKFVLKQYENAKNKYKFDVKKAKNEFYKKLNSEYKKLIDQENAYMITFENDLNKKDKELLNQLRAKKQKLILEQHKLGLDITY